MRVCLNETKIDENTLKRDGIIIEVEKMGYPKDLQFWNCCKSQKGYSGTAILVHKDFVGKVEKVEMDFGKPGKHDQEGRCVTAHFQSCVLVCTYVPNSGVIGLNRLKYRTEEWDIDLQAFLKEL